jgi:phosphatidylinositol-3-phosphatase
MTLPPPPPRGGQACASCAAPLAAEQRWCVVCGARVAGADPRTLLFGTAASAAAPAGRPASGTAPGDPAPTGEATAAQAVGGGPAAAPPRRGASPDLVRRRRAALPFALASLVGLFVVTGAGAPVSLAGMSQPLPFTVVLPAPAPVQIAAAPPADEAPVADEPADDTPADDAAEDPAPVDDTPADSGSDGGDDGTEDPGAEPPADASPISHVFMIVLASADVGALAHDETAAPYLSGTLAKSGTLLTDYRAIARGALANRIALVSGQGPTAQTLADCSAFGDVTPADALADGQTGGDGCVYGYETGTIADQLRGAGKAWKAYVEPAPAAASRGAAGGGACTVDAATTRRNPFLWFRGLAEAGDCARHAAPLSRLAADLADPDTTPALSLIASDAQLGSADADAFLERVVPQIQNSLTYANGGLIAITADQPPAAPTAPAPPAATPDPPAATLPADPAPPADTPPGATPPAATTPDPATTTPDPTRPTTPSTTATPQPSAAATTTSPTPALQPPASTAPAAAEPRARAAAAATPWPATYPNVGDAAAAGAGAPVGALLISPFTPAGRTDPTPSSHFTLLRTLEQLLGLDPLGYAAAATVRPLPDELFGATP